MLATLTWLGAASAQTPAASQPAPLKTMYNEALIKQRSAMLKERYAPLFAEIYAMNPEQKLALVKVMDGLEAAEMEYFRANDAALTKAMSDVRTYAVQMTQKTDDPAEREKLVKLQEAAMARYRELQSGAPLSIDKIAEAIEKTLPKDQAEKGHVVFLQRKPSGLRPPPSPVSAQNVNAAAQPMPGAGPIPSDPKIASPTKYRAATLAAPPLERWGPIVDAVIAHHNYDDGQKSRAKAIFRDIEARAREYAKSNAAAIAEAEKTAPSADRDNRLAELHRDVDLAYDELIQRIDNLARSGQVLATTTLDFAPPLGRWSVAVERTIAARRYDPQQSEKARAALAEAMKKGDAFMKAQGAELASSAAKPEQLHKAYAAFDTIFQNLKAEVEKLGPPPAAPPAPQPGPGGIGGH